MIGWLIDASTDAHSDVLRSCHCNLTSVAVACSDCTKYTCYCGDWGAQGCPDGKCMPANMYEEDGCPAGNGCAYVNYCKDPVSERSNVSRVCVCRGYGTSHVFLAKTWCTGLRWICATAVWEEPQLARRGPTVLRRRILHRVRLRLGD